MITPAANRQPSSSAKTPGTRRAELHLWYATLTVTLASGVMSTIGVYEVLAGSRAYSLSLSLLVGIVITAMLSGAWAYLFHAMPRARGRALVHLSLLLPPFLALVFLISTWTNATAIVGGPALNMHNRQFLNAYEQALEAVNRQVEGSERTLAAIRAEAAAFRNDVDGEIADGRLTGYAGRGVVSGTLEQIADKLEQMVLEVEAASVSTAAISAEASTAFANLQAHLERGHNDPVFVKARLEEIRQAIIQLNEQSPAAVLAAMLPTIRQGISFPSVQAANSRLGARQVEALESAVLPRVEQTFAALESLAIETAGETVELPRFEHLSAPEAAMRYFTQFPIYWGMAIAIDAMPLFFLILLVATAPRSQPGYDLSVNELHLAMAAYADLQHIAESSGNVTALPSSQRVAA